MGLSDDAEFVGDSSRSGGDVPVSHVTVRRGRSGEPKIHRYTADRPGEGQLQPRVGDNASAPAKAEPKAEPKSESRRVQPTIKLCSYDGSSPLESHIAKLNNCAKYYSWNSQEKVCHLKNSLEGPAAQILWQISDTATEEQVLELLRHRFGHINQAERFRAEMSMRSRKPGESVQELYNEIRRLLALSFPGESGGLYDIIGRDAFLASLDDPAMRVKVLRVATKFYG